MEMNGVRILCGDALEQLKTLPDESVHCCVTSPPYWGLRDYQVDGQLGLEQSPEEYIAKMVEIFREVRRVLRSDGTCWVNLGDSYSSTVKGSGGASAKQLSNAGSRYEMNQRLITGLKPKDLCGIPWRVAFALQADGWWLRQDIIWHKTNPMPESVTDRCTKAHEYVFLLSKSARYYYDTDAVAEPVCQSSIERLTQPNILGQHGSNRVPGKTNGNMKAVGNTVARNRRSVWTIATRPYKGAHFAVFPPQLVEPCVLAGTSEKGCCPHCGAPWKRIVKRQKMGKALSGRTADKHAQGLVTACGGAMTSPPSSQTIGWEQTCKCEQHGPVPCVVLDPFGGSGTTAEVALKHGRHAILIELNPEYIPLQEQRLSKVQPPTPLFDMATAAG